MYKGSGVGSQSLKSLVMVKTEVPFSHSEDRSCGYTNAHARAPKQGQ